MRKSIFITIAVLALASALLVAAQADKDNIKITKSGDKLSQVSFSHKKHDKTSSAKDCKACHEAVASQKTAHDLCIDCHKNSGSGPVKCKECHS